MTDGGKAPVFYDPSGLRGKWVRACAWLLAIALSCLLAVTAGAVLWAPARAPLHLRGDVAQPRPAAAIPVAAAPGPWLPRPAAAHPAAERYAFYMPWDSHARTTLDQQFARLDWVVAGLATLTGPEHRFAYERDDHLQSLRARPGRHPRLLVMVQNAMDDGSWDGAGLKRMLNTPSARRRFLTQIAATIEAEQAQGVSFDLENLPETAHPAYLRFLAEAQAAFAPRGWQVTIAAPLADPAWDLAAYARVTDRIFLMAYDEHWPGGEAGPIASQPWFAANVAAAVKAVGPAKSVVAIGNYAYDWSAKGTDILTVRDAWKRASAAGALPSFDKTSGNSHFAYKQDGVAHQTWLLDAASAWNQLRAIEASGAAGVALWRLGSEDPTLWNAWYAAPGTQPDLTIMTRGTGVEFEGTGEVLRVDAAAADGRRAIDFDSTQLIRDVRTESLPTPYLVRRTAGAAGMVALTFDDGPDPIWTPRILDVLKTQGVPATFFVTGANAVGQPELLRRILAEGSELGNHSTSHSDLGQLPEPLVRAELNATQRLIEAYTGRSTRLFRAPLLGNAEPTSLDELVPARIAAEMGYVTIGLHVDPLDWQTPSADQIVARTVEQVARGTAANPAQIVLLHDAGGDRSHTLAALPRIIAELRARGYRFVGVSELAGLNPAQAMPVVAGTDMPVAHTSRAMFLGLAGGNRALTILFYVAIALGLARALTLGLLAWRARRAGPAEAPPHLVPRFVSVLIPAYNEEAVIEESVRRILTSRDVRIEVIVIDDGSRDATSAIVTRAFGADPRVRLLTLENGGKARALNRGLEIARGDIVVALDADTQFEPETVARLVRWFADPAIGAVAGNAKVGNQINLITRWQALEYVTAQNLERRALASLNAVTVVPGAVGAWRRTALDSVGGYPADTLAEDQDLTIAIQRAGWRVACDQEAIAWTESPETARGLFKQRFRWAYGTLQALWKHRGIWREGRAKGLARVGLPQAWLFQVFFALVSPLIDLALLANIATTGFRIVNRGGAAIGGELLAMAGFWCAFTAVDLACGWLAYRLDHRPQRFVPLRLLAQRIGYRQLMYFVVLRAVFAAISGPRVGWGKLERSGNVSAAAMAEPLDMPAEIEPARIAA